ncbi:DUF397 domain-containing protein [Streptomyces hainanensis]|uniref:DUF397 domain-containing protein n=1 Tax=Streptomyces hainanensis TaxID=402648 RepID=A0A4R4T5S4_9ACTN|nr:DUF397 domain-containing protein [Streptomyces hainanensis]TDC72217.1 DUF397 domain-containing protein [Streptomyces hainanensis]
MSENRWQKSSFSTGGNECIELAASVDGTLFRESDTPGLILTTNRTRLRTLALGIKAGDFGSPLGGNGKRARP